MKRNMEANIMLICLPVSTVCLLILVCQLLLLNPQVKRFYDGFWTGFWNGITLNVPR